MLDISDGYTSSVSLLLPSLPTSLTFSHIAIIYPSLFYWVWYGRGTTSSCLPGCSPTVPAVYDPHDPNSVCFGFNERVPPIAGVYCHFSDPGRVLGLVRVAVPHTIAMVLLQLGAENGG